MYLFNCERDYTIRKGLGYSYVGYFPIALEIALSREVICDVTSASDRELNEGCDHLMKNSLFSYGPRRSSSRKATYVWEPTWCPSLTILLSKSCFDGSVMGSPQFWPLWFMFVSKSFTNFILKYEYLLDKERRFGPIPREKIH